MQTKLELPAADGIAPEQIPEVMGKLAEYQAQLQIRLLTAHQTTPPSRQDRFLTADEAAERLGVSKRVLHEWAKAGRMIGAEKHGKFWKFAADTFAVKKPRKCTRNVSVSKAPALTDGERTAKGAE